MKKVILVAGARPNFMKIAPIIRAMQASGKIDPVLVHTGQHYDHSMSGSFFESLGIPEPNYNLNVGSGSHAVQTAAIMVAFEEVCLKEKPNTVLVVGDVNSTVATGLVAKKLNLELVHVEAGLRSGDREMPEEINRLATDAITDVFFTTEDNGTQNLLAEGQSPDKVHFVGHVMIDNLLYQKSRLEANGVPKSVAKMLEQLPKKYACMTLHRPSNVDHEDVLRGILSAIKIIAKEIPVVFPCHPRTLKQLDLFGISDDFIDCRKEIPADISRGILLLNPLGYDEFLSFWKNSSLLLTDSGGLQEETTALKIPCITIRENTERPVTVDVGSNELVGIDPAKILEYGKKVLTENWKDSKIPDLWDGKASERMVEILLKS